MSDVITIGGRKFTPFQQSTLGHDIYMMSHVRGAKLDIDSKNDSESYDEYVQRLLSLILESDKTLKLLAGLLIPAGLKPHEWTEEIAKDTELFFYNLIDPVDKEKVKNQIVGLLIGFFQNELLCSVNSQKFSEMKAAQ